MKDVHIQAFIEEASELLTQLESVLLELENEPDDNGLVANVFRILHTIKGSSGMFGYDEIAEFTHDIENVYDRIRNGELKITKEIIDLTLTARDQIATMLVEHNSARSTNNEITNNVLASFKQIVQEFYEDTTVEHNEPDHNTEESTGSLTTFMIQMSTSPDLFLNGTNPVLLLKELKDMGEAIIVARTDSVPSFSEINHDNCYLSWNIILKTKDNVDAIKDVFIFVDDTCGISIKVIDEENKLGSSESFNEFNKVCNEAALAGNYDIEGLLQSFSVDKKASNKSLETNTNGHKNKDRTEKGIEVETVQSLRVSTEKLDELVNLVGELVTTQARLTQLASLRNDPEITSVSEEVERITWSLRDSALNIRMLPIGSTFSKFKRLVRDLSRELGKEVELTTDGAETELDKTVLEKIGDPLVHIIRNSIDHGIESPSERENAGKPRTGWVQLSASQAGGFVIIEISDDGAGMDKNVIKAKAVKNGLISENAELTDNEIYSLIFAPGFSTASVVTNVSGRGVGMDVVKRAIEGLRGTVEVSSKKDSGTRITLKLPLTLAIIDGLLVKIDNDFYILPLSSVEECVELTDKEINNAHGRNIINIRGGIIPYIRLRERFDFSTPKPSIEQIVISDLDGNRVGFVVDKVYGQHQTVLKSLGKFYKNVHGVSGATIMGDGTVALIIDIQQILKDEEILQHMAELV